ncbi:hypothetical protein BJF85_22210 [Saccharomonospora sp. CUA-673]|uniref:Pycsar system effector family protein n=1 Tax=Saccharomonospora sp. CUA-673 TaxID=1904969 RepID=UPI00095BE273|nr:Pycsar system effector family protein [Saccharomonospora sp. CUA-673]OLT42657.1 hypothetical protein BJF85_22210 [Saccharomonospora sp. CUA-673]
MTATENTWKALGQIHELVKLADTKAGLVLAASGVLAGILTQLATSPGLWTTNRAQAVLILLGLVLVLLSTLFALRVFMPRTGLRGARSLLNFANVAARFDNPDDFSRASRALFTHEEQMQRALAEQVWATSRIARRKFRTVTSAIWFFGSGVVVTLSAALFV